MRRLCFGLFVASFVLLCAAGSQAGLVAYYPMDDPGDPATLLDVVGANNGVVQGAAYTADAGGHTGLPGDYAIDFTSGNVRVPGGGFAGNAVDNNSMTFAFWQKAGYTPGSPPNSSAFWAEAPSAGGGQRGAQAHAPWSNRTIYWDTAGCCGGDTRLTTSGTDISDDNDWHHLAFVKAGVHKEIWVDGVRKASHDGATASLLPFTNLFIGSNRGGGDRFRGLIDDFAVWDRALSASEIQQLAAGTGAPTDFAGPAPDPGWVGRPVGGGGGHFDYDAGTGTLTVTADGQDIWGTYDRFYFVLPEDPGNPGQPLKTSGDFIARTRIVDMTEGVWPWQKSGLMARADLDGNSIHVMGVMTEANGVVQQWRDSKGGGSAPGGGAGGTPPGHDNYWLMFTRSGQTFNTYWAPDVGGAPGNWTSVPPTWASHTSPNMPQDVYLGVMMTAQSQVSHQTATTVFDNIEFIPASTLTVMGRSSGGSTWHFSSDPDFYDDPGGLAAPVTLAGGTQTGNATFPSDIVDDVFYVVVEANDTGTTPSFAGALIAPVGYVFDADNDGSQDPGETQFFSTEGAPYASGKPEWTAGGSLAGWRFLSQDADEVGPEGDPFPAGTEAIWYGASGGTVYLAAAVPQLIPGEWEPPTVQGSPVSSVTTESGITARVVRTDGMQLRNIDVAVDALTYLGPNVSGHYATSESPIPQLDIGNTGGVYPGSVAMLAPDHKTSGADGDDTAARFTAYVYIDPAWDMDPGPDFSYVRTFAVASADGFRLKVGDSTVLEFEGTRGMPGTPDLIPVNFPAPGYWPIELDWFNGTGYQRPVGGTIGGNGLIGWYHDRSGDDFGALRGWRNDLTTGTGSPAESEFYFPDNYAYGPWGNLENNFKVRWVGTIDIPATGNYNFRMDTDDRSAIFIDVDGDGVVDPAPGSNWAWTVTWNNVNLSAGAHKVEFWALEYGGGEWSRLQWQKPGDPGLSTVPADVFSWEYQLPVGVGANTPGSPAIPGAIPGGETAGDGALVQAALNSGVGSTTAAIQYFQSNPNGGTTEARARVNITDSGNAGTFGGDDDYPGAAPGTDYNNIAFRARALFYSPGNETYAFAVASDDSYRIDINGKTFGWYNGGRGQDGNNSNFVYVTFPEPGLYKFALYHHEGGSGAGIELSHKATGNLLVSSPDPEVEGFTTDLANRFYTFQTHASMRRVSTDLVGTAFVHIPALGMDIAPDHWVIEQGTHFEDVPGLLGAYYVRNGDWAPGTFLGYRHDLVPHGSQIFGADSPAQTNFNFPDNYGYGPWGNQEDNLHVIWTGTLTVPEEGDYSTATVNLTAGEHDFLFFANEGGGGEFADLLWLPPWDTTHDPNAPNTWDFIPADYFSFDFDLWETLFEGTGQIGDILNEGLFHRFSFDPDTEYTLRLTVDFFGDQIVIGPETFVFVPEPGTCLLLGGGLLMLVRRRRRRK